MESRRHHTTTFLQLPRSSNYLLSLLATKTTRRFFRSFTLPEALQYLYLIFLRFNRRILTFTLMFGAPALTTLMFSEAVTLSISRCRMTNCFNLVMILLMKKLGMLIALLIFVFYFVIFFVFAAD